MKNNEIDRTTAMTMLTGDALQEWRWTLREYIERGHIPEKYARELENVSARAHITRYAAMLQELGAIAEETYGIEETGLAAHLRGVYEERYLRAGFDAQQMIGTGWNIAMPDKRKIDAAVRTPWADGKNFSDRIWRDKRKLESLLQPLVNRMIFTGEAPDNAIRILSHELNVSRTNAARLIQTESAHIAAVADRDCYEELGLEKVQFLATLEKHTCSACGSLDGTIVDMKDYAPGVNIPPIHPRCRCTTVPYFEDAEGERIARDASTGEQYDVPESMTFEEWLETQRVDNIEKSGIMKSAREANGLRRSRFIEMTEEEIEFVKHEIVEIGADPTVFQIVQGAKTSYDDELDIVFIGSDVFPSAPGSHPTDRLTVRAMLAHEYYGHKANRGTSLPKGDWRDEFRASYTAAKTCPNLTDEERADLVSDAINRARENGVEITFNAFMRRVLYGY